MANIITCCRILFSVFLLWTSPFSFLFYVWYLMAGLTDMMDGIVARKTNTVSHFGSKLDTFADFIFFIICFLKIYPCLQFTNWIWVWILMIFFMKILNIVYGYILYKEIIAVHSLFNKLTGFLLFIIPLTVSVINVEYSVIFLCILASIAVIHEFYMIKKQGMKS